LRRDHAEIAQLDLDAHRLAFLENSRGS